MKKVLFGGIALFTSVLFMNNVHAEDLCTVADDGTLSSQLSSSTCSTINLENGKTYNGFTISRDVTIVGNGATVNGTIEITGGTKVKISDLTMNDTSKSKDDPYINVTSSSTNVDLTLSKVIIYNGNKDNSQTFTSAGTGVKVSYGVKAGTKVTIDNSIIHTKYAVWMEGSNSDLIVNNSDLAGYAALDLTSSSHQTENNKVTINHSTLTGYAIGESKNSNDYGTIVVGNKKNVTIDIINNSVITNNFANGIDARSDLILISDYDGNSSTDVNVTVSNSTLKNTAKDNTLGAVYNANNEEGNTFKTQNTAVTGPLFANSDNYFVDFKIDGKSNIVEADKEGKLDQSAIPSPKKDGYKFEGWYLEDTYKNVFDTTSKVEKNMIVYAKFTEIENPNALDNVPKTGSSLPIALIGLLGLATLTGAYSLKLAYTRK